MKHQANFSNQWTFEAYGPDGSPKWSHVVNNAIVDEGLDDILTQYWTGSGYSAAFFVGLTAATPSVDGGDTMASHAGWTEVTDYDESARPSLVPGAVSGQSVDNAAAKASVTASSDDLVVGGGFIATDSAKGGTAGKLIAVAAFDAGDKTLDSGDVLNVTVTATAASA